MKKVLLVLAMIALTFGMNAQEEYGTYKSGTISASVTLDKGKVFLDLTKDGKYGLILTQKDRLALTTFLNDSRIKFIEWSEKAVANSVKDIHKDIDKKSFKGIFSYGGWKIGTSSLRTIFWVEKDGTTNLYLYGSVMTSSTNRYMKSDSAMVTITSEDDFNSLINIISDKTVNDFLEKKKTATDIFN
tara:strand:- start:51 stop:611 length:561 start_codon:yes stop_codon:yes gene_type:complete